VGLEPGHGNRLDRYVENYAERTHGMGASQIRALFSVANRPEVVSLAGGMPFVSALPLDVISENASGLIADHGAQALQYATAQGDPVLREQIVEIMALEGIRAHPDDVVVTTGSQQALDLVTRIFVDPGDVILCEAPSYVGALQAFISYQADIRHVAMDDHGLVPEALAAALDRLDREGKRAKFLYTIPSFHNPAGVTQDQGRREEILAICQSAGVLVIEDDPYGLLGFDGTIPRAMRADDDEGVIYLGSFSKTFAPGLRVGWACAPHAVREKLVLASEATMLNSSTFSQLLVSRYLSTHPWMEQVKVFRELYRDRRDAILDSLEQLMPEGTVWTKPEGGFYVWLTLPDGIDATAMLPLAVTGRVAYVPGTAFFADGQGRSSMRLSYCYPDPDRIREGVRRLAGVIEEEVELRATFGPVDSSSALGGPEQAAPGPDIA
jgi:DNA-binding transcriptional MocR family regulator